VNHVIIVAAPIYQADCGSAALIAVDRTIASEHICLVHAPTPLITLGRQHPSARHLSHNARCKYASPLYRVPWPREVLAKSRYLFSQRAVSRAASPVRQPTL
jgi:hypothetical protein